MYVVLRCSDRFFFDDLEQNAHFIQCGSTVNMKMTRKECRCTYESQLGCGKAGNQYRSRTYEATEI